MPSMTTEEAIEFLKILELDSADYNIGPYSAEACRMGAEALKRERALREKIEFWKWKEGLHVGTTTQRFPGAVYIDELVEFLDNWQPEEPDAP